MAFTYFRWYKACFPSRFPESLLSCVNLVCSVCENLGLLLLTYVSSSETYCRLVFRFVCFVLLFKVVMERCISSIRFLPVLCSFALSVVHKEGFVLFIISSFVYMLTTCRLWKSIKKYSLSPKVRNIKSDTLIMSQ